MKRFIWYVQPGAQTAVAAVPATLRGTVTSIDVAEAADLSLPQRRSARESVVLSYSAPSRTKFVMQRVAEVEAVRAATMRFRAAKSRLGSGSRCSSLSWGPEAAASRVPTPSPWRGRIRPVDEDGPLFGA